MGACYSSQDLAHKHAHSHQHGADVSRRGSLHSQDNIQEAKASDAVGVEGSVRQPVNMFRGSSQELDRSVKEGAAFLLRRSMNDWSKGNESRCGPLRGWSAADAQLESIFTRQSRFPLGHISAPQSPSLSGQSPCQIPASSFLTPILANVHGTNKSLPVWAPSGPIALPTASRCMSRQDSDRCNSPRPQLSRTSSRFFPPPQLSVSVDQSKRWGQGADLAGAAGTQSPSAQGARKHKKATFACRSTPVNLVTGMQLSRGSSTAALQPEPVEQAGRDTALSSPGQQSGVDLSTDLTNTGDYVFVPLVDTQAMDRTSTDSYVPMGGLSGMRSEDLEHALAARLDICKPWASPAGTPAVPSYGSSHVISSRKQFFPAAARAHCKHTSSALLRDCKPHSGQHAAVERSLAELEAMQMAWELAAQLAGADFPKPGPAQDVAVGAS